MKRMLLLGDEAIAQGALDAEEAKRLDKKVRKEGMDLADFLAAMKQIQRLGPMEGIPRLEEVLEFM